MMTNPISELGSEVIEVLEYLGGLMEVGNAQHNASAQAAAATDIAQACDITADVIASGAFNLDAMGPAGTGSSAVGSLAGALAIDSAASQVCEDMGQVSAAAAMGAINAAIDAGNAQIERDLAGDPGVNSNVAVAELDIDVASGNVSGAIDVGDNIGGDITDGGTDNSGPAGEYSGGEVDGDGSGDGGDSGGVELAAVRVGSPSPTLPVTTTPRLPVGPAPRLPVGPAPKLPVTTTATTKAAVTALNALVAKITPLTLGKVTATFVPPTVRPVVAAAPPAVTTLLHVTMPLPAIHNPDATSHGQPATVAPEWAAGGVIYMPAAQPTLHAPIH